ncbi:MAG: hypothetical protein ABJM57_00015 [Lentilitoribacter sp.]
MRCQPKTGLLSQRAPHLEASMSSLSAQQTLAEGIILASAG